MDYFISCLKFQAFRICQLRAQGIHNLSYKERIEMWNLEMSSLQS